MHQGLSGSKQLVAPESPEINLKALRGRLSGLTQMQKIEPSTKDEQSRLKQLFQVGTPTVYNKLPLVSDNSLIL